MDGEPVAIIQEIGCPGGWLDQAELPANVTFLRDATKVTDEGLKSLEGMTRLRFAYFHCLIHKTKEIRPGWEIYREPATRYFWRARRDD